MSSKGYLGIPLRIIWASPGLHLGSGRRLRIIQGSSRGSFWNPFTHRPGIILGVTGGHGLSSAGYLGSLPRIIWASSGFHLGIIWRLFRDHPLII